MKTTAPENTMQKMTNKGGDASRLIEEGGFGKNTNNLLEDHRMTGLETLLRGLSVLLLVVTFPFTIWFCFRRIQQYERGIIFRFGKIKNGKTMGPGMHFTLPLIDEMKTIDTRTASFDVRPQQMLSKDSVTVTIDAVVFCHVRDPLMAVCNATNYWRSTQLLATTTLRTVLASKTLDEILTDRENIAKDIFTIVNEPVRAWGVDVERVEIKDVVLPANLQRAMAAAAEAEREAKAKIISAQGEKDASHALTEAATVIGQSTGAMQLRYLQTLHSISAEKNSTICFPLPMDILSALTTNHKSS